MIADGYTGRKGKGGFYRLERSGGERRKQAIDLVTGARCPGSIEEQATLVLANLGTILLASGSRMEELLRVTIYLSDVVHWEVVNALYAKVLGSHRPARAVVPTGPLHHGFLIEVEAVAATSEQSRS